MNFIPGSDFPYENQMVIHLSHSASAVMNNLTLRNGNESDVPVIGVIHHNLVNMVKMSSGNFKPKYCQWNSTSDINILQARWLKYGDFEVLVLLSIIGFNIYNSETLSLLFSFTFPETVDLSKGLVQGIEKLHPDMLCVGSPSGIIFTFVIPKVGLDMDKFKTGECHNATITGLATSEYGKELVSVDAIGGIALWNHKDDLLMNKWKIYSDPKNNFCTGVSIWKSYIICSYGSGHIRLFDVSWGHIVAEVTAHASCITGIDVASRAGLLLSVSEDSFLKIWQLTDSVEQMIIPKSTTCIQDTLLVGGKFITPAGRSLAVIGYDLNEILVCSE